MIQTKKPSWSSLNSTRNFMTRLTTISKTSRRKKDFGNSYQIPETCLSRLWRSGSRLNIPDMASSLRQSQDQQLRRAQNNRFVWRRVSVFYEVTSEGREFPSLLHSSHPRDLLQPQPQLQFQIHPETQNLRWKSALHQMLLISLQAPVLSDDNLQSPPPLLKIQS